MSLFAIGDFHLSLTGKKPMDTFGADWVNHHIKIKANWVRTVKPSDTVIITGDISWALKFNDALADLHFIDELPGIKILLKGNHDYWWTSLNKNQQAFPGLKFLQNNFFAYGEYAICGSRGWLCPFETNRPLGFDAYADTLFSAFDLKIYLRELERLERSFALARKAGFKKFICAMHFPPASSNTECSGFIDIIEKYGADYAVYGHIHGKEQFARIITGIGKCKYMLTSCDYLDFSPKLVLTEPSI